MAEVVLISNFEKEAKKLLKKYSSFKKDLTNLIFELENNPTSGTPLGRDCFKIRMAITSKSKGKSSGTRVITCYKVIKDTVFLLSVYDKSSREDIEDKRLTEILKEANLLRKQ
jgi:mRNA-degrading endonuclease RelE of RelBE toxin-antitoxin system